MDRKDLPTESYFVYRKKEHNTAFGIINEIDTVNIKEYVRVQAYDVDNKDIPFKNKVSSNKENAMLYLDIEDAEAVANVIDTIQPDDWRLGKVIIETDEKKNRVVFKYNV